MTSKEDPGEFEETADTVTLRVSSLLPGPLSPLWPFSGQLRLKLSFVASQIIYME